MTLPITRKCFSFNVQRLPVSESTADGGSASTAGECQAPRDAGRVAQHQCATVGDVPRGVQVRVDLVSAGAALKAVLPESVALLRMAALATPLAGMPGIPLKGVIIRHMKGRRTRPISASEIPPHIKGVLDLSSQALRPGEGKAARLSITAICPSCGKERNVLVSTTREALKRGNFTGYCQSCAAKKKLQPLGEKSRNWKGGRRIVRGYVMVYDASHPAAQNGYVQEHRIVMEQQLGRHLYRGETVHHKNGIKTDNRPENLELWAKSHPAGQRFEEMSSDCLRGIVKEAQAILESRGESC